MQPNPNIPAISPRSCDSCPELGSDSEDRYVQLTKTWEYENYIDSPSHVFMEQEAPMNPQAQIEQQPHLFQPDQLQYDGSFPSQTHISHQYQDPRIQQPAVPPQEYWQQPNPVCPDVNQAPEPLQVYHKQYNQPPHQKRQDLDLYMQQQNQMHTPEPSTNQEHIPPVICGGRNNELQAPTYPQAQHQYQAVWHQYGHNAPGHPPHQRENRASMPYVNPTPYTSSTLYVNPMLNTGPTPLVNPTQYISSTLNTGPMPYTRLNHTAGHGESKQLAGYQHFTGSRVPAQTEFYPPPPPPPSFPALYPQDPVYQFPRPIQDTEPEILIQGYPATKIRVETKEIYGTIYYRDPETGQFPERVRTPVTVVSLEPPLEEADEKQDAGRKAMELALKEEMLAARPMRKLKEEARREARELALKQKAEKFCQTRNKSLGVG
ncbi:hypothetical protein BDD12DRAFT_984501 [Trichophaea hybrida]|nr:hypothetical protein BDD12DRAFT_984501 [Trichophaea hybrida]